MCVTLCDSAGVMYWGEHLYGRIEAANTDGSGRKLILTVNNARYFAFTLYAGFIYYTDLNPPYVCLKPSPDKVGRALQYCPSVCVSSIAHVWR